jgi:CheY-like chemotaxis protein
MPPSSRVKPCRILLVEDHVDTRSLMRRYLERHGYEVLCAGGIGEAKVLAATSAFDVLISDLRFPDGSGLDLPNALRAHQSGFSAIALTGNALPGDSELSLAAGYSAHLTKPLAFPELLATLDRCCTSEQPAA